MNYFDLFSFYPGSQSYFEIFPQYYNSNQELDYWFSI